MKKHCCTKPEWRCKSLRRVLESVRDGLRRKKPPPLEAGILMPARQGRLGFKT